MIFLSSIDAPLVLARLTSDQDVAGLILGWKSNVQRVMHTILSILDKYIVFVGYTIFPIQIKSNYFKLIQI